MKKENLLATLVLIVQLILAVMIASGTVSTVFVLKVITVFFGIKLFCFILTQFSK